MAEPSFWDTLKGVGATQASKVLQPLSGTFSTVIGNVTNTAQGKVAGVADKLVSTTAPNTPAKDVLKPDPAMPDAKTAAKATSFTLLGLLIAAVLIYWLVRKTK